MIKSNYSQVVNSDLVPAVHEQVRPCKKDFLFLFLELIPQKHFEIPGKAFGKMFSFTEQRPSSRCWSDSPLSSSLLLNLNETNSPCASCGLLFTVLSTCPGGWFTWLVSEEQ